MKVRRHRGAKFTITAGAFTLAIGAWRYGWKNPSWYERFDRVRFVCHLWKNGARKDEWLYEARGLDYEVEIRTDGYWHLPRRV